MLRSVTLTLLMGSTLFGGLLDFRTLEKAKEAYANAQYGEAAALYESIDDKNDDLRYNLGDAYYKDKKYEEALKQYEQVHKAELRAKSLHNMGNAYANTKQVDKAIAAYEEALKLGEDEDTRFNLELLKKEQEEQQKQDQQDQKNDDQDQQKQDQNGQDQQKKDDQQKNDQTSDEEKKQEQQNKQNDEKSGQEQKEQEEKEKQSEEEKASKEDASDEEKRAMKEGKAKEEPISDMQERKYEKMLDKRGIKTLMVPLKTEGAHDDEKTAW